MSIVDIPWYRWWTKIRTQSLCVCFLRTWINCQSAAFRGETRLHIQSIDLSRFGRHTRTGPASVRALLTLPLPCFDAPHIPSIHVPH